jgi:hypothetical protein
VLVWSGRERERERGLVYEGERKRKKEGKTGGWMGG